MGDVEAEAAGGPFRVWLRSQLAEAGMPTSEDVTGARLWGLWQGAYDAGLVPVRRAATAVPSPGTAVTLLVRGVVTDGGWVTADGAGQWLLTAEQLAEAVKEGRVWVR